MIMSCNQEHFLKQEQDCKDTYLSRLAENIDYIIYRETELNTYDYNEKTKTLLVPSEGGIGDTFVKTYNAFLWVTRNIEYDYIFRTNTSTYVNIDLLNEFVQTINNPYEIWGGEVVYIMEDHNKYLNNSLLYLRGNGIIFSKEMITNILNYGWGYCYIHRELIDDMILGCIYNNINLLKNGIYIPYIKSFKEGWYKASLVPYTEHQVCRMNNENIDFDFLKQMMIIQIRNWYDRTKESEHFKIIDEVFKNNKDIELNKTVQEQYEYSNNPELFLGHNYGFKPFNNVFKIRKGDT